MVTTTNDLTQTRTENVGRPKKCCNFLPQKFAKGPTKQNRALWAPAAPGVRRTHLAAEASLQRRSSWRWHWRRRQGQPGVHLYKQAAQERCQRQRKRKERVTSQRQPDGHESQTPSQQLASEKLPAQVSEEQAQRQPITALLPSSTPLVNTTVSAESASSW